MAKVEPGMRIGYLTVLYSNGYKVYNKRSKQIIYRCRCDCGKEIDVVSSTLYSAVNKHYKPSCGCNTDQIRQISINKCSKNSKSGIKGVFYFRGQWYATIHINGKTKNVRAINKDDAVKKRQKLEEYYFDPLKKEFEQKIGGKENVQMVKEHE